MAVKVQCPSCAAVYSVFEPTVGRRVRCPQCNELVEATPYVPGARVVKPTLAKKVLDLAESQGLLDGKAITELRKQLAESKFVVTPEAIAKVLVDHGHLTPFQARKLVGAALAPEPEPEPEAESKPKAGPVPTRPPRDIPTSMKETVDLTFADDDEKTSGESLSATEEEIIDLEPVESEEPSAPKGRRPAWKTDATISQSNRNLDATSDDLVALEPIPGIDPAPLAPVGGMPAIDDLVPLGPATGRPHAPLANPLDVGSLPRIEPPRNMWDSPFLLVGGGVLGAILVAFIALLYLLTRGTAAELLAKAEEEYRQGSYAAAITGYDRFLKKYSSNPEASKARVRRGMAQIRQVSDDGKNPRLALQVAKETLPQIEKEASFPEARAELAVILTDVAEALATQALKADNKSQKAELAKLAGEAMALVNNPSYLPAAERKQHERRLVAIVDKLKAAQRGILQDEDLAKAIAQIKAALEQADIAAAYRLRDELVRTYPVLDTDPTLLAVVRQVVEQERELVKVTESKVAAFTSASPAKSEAVVLVSREGPTAGNSPAKPVFMAVDGAAFALDATSGRVLWRLYLGSESTLAPLAVNAGDHTDALVANSTAQELMRVHGTTGKLVWRQPIGEPFSGPVLAENQIIVTTRAGKVLSLDATSGALLKAAALPQRAIASAALDVRQGRVFQLGEQATLFALAADSLACVETYFLNHRAGAIFVPPVAVLDVLLICESPGDDYTLVHVLAADSKTKRLARVGQPLRLKGRVVTPLAVSGRRVAAVTDLGQVALYEVDVTNPKEPVRLIAGVEASESLPLAPHYALSGNRLWIASKHCALLELQPAVQQFNRSWTVHQGDSFVGTLNVEDGVLIAARRRAGESALQIEASDAAQGRPRWITRLASPVAALWAAPGSDKLEVLTAEGRLLTLENEHFRAGQLEQTGSKEPATAIFADVLVSADSKKALWTDKASPGHVYSYEIGSGSQPAVISLPSVQAAAPAQPFASGLLVPLVNGSIALLAASTGNQIALPFVPPLSPGSLPEWSRPAIRQDGRSFLASDGRGGLYAVALKDQPQAALLATSESRIDGRLVSSLIAAGAAAVGVVRADGGDAVLRIDIQRAAGLEQVPLKDSFQAGPFVLGDMVLIAAETDGLLCFDHGGKLRWQVPVDRGPVVGVTLAAASGELIVAHQPGVVRKVDSRSGQEQARLDLGEPLGPALCIQGKNLILAGTGGVIHRMPVPQAK